MQKILRKSYQTERNKDRREQLVNFLSFFFIYFY